MRVLEAGDVPCRADQESDDADQADPDPGSPPRRGEVTIRQQVGDQDQPWERNTQAPAAADPRPARRESSPRTGTPATHRNSRPARSGGSRSPAVGAAQHQEADGHWHRHSGREGHGTHWRQCDGHTPRPKGTRELFPSRPGHPTHAAGSAGNPWWRRRRATPARRRSGTVMSTSAFEKLLPWSGVVAGVCWIGQDALQREYTKDGPGLAATTVIRSHLGLDYASVACLVLMGISLLFFATAIRNLLRSAEAAKRRTRPSPYGGWIVSVAGISQMVVWNWGLINGEPTPTDDAVVRMSSFVPTWADYSASAWPQPSSRPASAACVTSVLPKSFALPPSSRCTAPLAARAPTGRPESPTCSSFCGCRRRRHRRQAHDPASELTAGPRVRSGTLVNTGLYLIKLVSGTASAGLAAAGRGVRHSDRDPLRILFPFNGYELPERHWTPWARRAASGRPWPGCCTSARGTSAEDRARVPRERGRSEAMRAGCRCCAAFAGGLGERPGRNAPREHCRGHFGAADSGCRLHRHGNKWAPGVGRRADRQRPRRGGRRATRRVTLLKTTDRPILVVSHDRKHAPVHRRFRRRPELVKMKLTSGSTVLMPDQQCRRGHAHRNPSKASWLRRTPLDRRQRSATPIAEITRNDA